MNGDLQKNSACQVIISREKSNEGEYSLILAAITTHKRPPEMVERAIKSVIAQTYTDWNLVVVDDSPADWELRDDVMKMVEGYSRNDSRIRYVAHDRNYGVSHARNTALGIAVRERYEYIAYLDDDDEWLPKKLEKQLARLEECGENTALVYCGYCIIDDASGRTTIMDIYAGGNLSMLNAILQENVVGSTSFPLIRTRCLAEIGGFDKKLEPSEDYDAWLRLAERFEIACVKEPLVNYHMHNLGNLGGSASRRLNAMQMFMEKYKTYLENDKNLHWYKLIGISVLYSHNRQYGKSVKAWLKAISLCPFKIVGNLKGVLKIFLPLDFYWRMKLGFRMRYPRLFGKLKSIKIKIFGEWIKE